MLTVHGKKRPYSRADRRHYFTEQAVKMAGRAARKAFDKWASGTKSSSGGGGSNSGAGRPSKRPARRARRATTGGKQYTSSYEGSMQVASASDLNKITKVKGQGKPRGKIVVNKITGKARSAQKRKYSKATYGTYYIGSNPNIDSVGNIGKLSRRYTKPSLDEKHGTGWIFNVGAVPLHWNPQNLGKIGNQVLEPNPPPLTYGPNPFYEINGDNSALEQRAEGLLMKQSSLPETATPYSTGDIPVESFFTVPNTILSQIKLDLSFCSASNSDQLLTIQVLKNSSSEPVVPGHFSQEGPDGGISNEDMIKHLCNHRKNASGRQLEILYTYTTVLKGINLNAKSPKVHYVKKTINCNFRRSTCRRVSSATQSDTLAGQYTPTFVIDQSGSMYNTCYVRAMATCLDNNVYLNKTVPGMPGNADPGNMGNAKYWINTAQAFDMETMKNKGQTTLVNARFRYGGCITVRHFCKETARGFGSVELRTIGGLQDQINELTSQVGALAAYGEEHVEELDEHIADEQVHCESDEPAEEESYTHTHGGDTELHVYGHAREHSHPETTSHSHDDAVVE